MLDPEWLTWAMQAIAGVIALKVCFPHLLLLLGLRGYRNGTFGGPDELEPDNLFHDGGDSADDEKNVYVAKYQDLLDRGFQPLGVHWSRIGRTISTESYICGAGEHRCLAQIYARSWNLYLVTAFTGGAVTITTDVETQERQVEGYWLSSLPGKSVRDLLAEQRRKINLWDAEGCRPLPVATLADVEPVLRAVNTHPANGRFLTAIALNHLLVLLVILVVSSLVTGSLFGFGGTAPYWGVILSGLFLLWAERTSSTRVKLDERLTES